MHSNILMISALNRVALTTRVSVSTVSTVSFSTSQLSRGTEGLQSFFGTSNGWSWNITDQPSGTPWSAALLRGKSFEDLHALWWICCREQNKLYSQKHESEVFKVMFPQQKALRSCKITMAHIKQVLGERKLSYEKACEIKAREEARIALTDAHLAKLPTDEGVATARSISVEVSAEIVKEIMRTVPVPALGVIAGAIGLGVRPYRQGLLPVSKYRLQKWKRVEADKQKSHENNYYIV